MNIEPKKQAELEKVLLSAPMQQIIACEPGVRTILEIAASPQPRENRWIAYEALKRMAQKVVGFDAQQAELRTCQHYDVLIEAIDRLLPENSEESEGLIA